MKVPIAFYTYMDRQGDSENLRKTSVDNRLRGDYSQIFF